MGNRRMFTKIVTDDDKFVTLPASAQALYLHLSMSADDDGFSNEVTTSMFKSHATTADLEMLLERKFLYQFEDGVIVIRHWRMANALRRDRYTETSFQEDLAKLDLAKNGEYSMSDEVGCRLVAKRLPQDKLSKDKLSKDNKEIYKEKPVRNQIPPTVDMVKAYCIERGNNVDPQTFCDFYDSKDWYVGKNKMKDWQAAVRTWEKSDRQPKDKTISDMREIVSGMTPEEYEEMERKFR